MTQVMASHSRDNFRRSDWRAIIAGQTLTGIKIVYKRLKRYIFFEQTKCRVDNQGMAGKKRPIMLFI